MSFLIYYVLLNPYKGVVLLPEGDFAFTTLGKVWWGMRSPHGALGCFHNGQGHGWFSLI